MILADDREPAEILHALQLKPPGVRVERLGSGDYCFGGIGIERKTLSDFFSSLKDGRLYFQLDQMSAMFATTYLFIEGFFDFSYVTNPNYLYRILGVLAIEFGTRIVFTRDCADTAQAIRRIYFRQKRGSNRGYPAKRMELFSLRLQTGISYKRLRLLLNRFRSMRGVARATRKQMLQIKGIGRSTVERINLFLDAEF